MGATNIDEQMSCPLASSQHWGDVYEPKVKHGDPQRATMLALSIVVSTGGSGKEFCCWGTFLSMVENADDPDGDLQQPWRLLYQIVRRDR